MIEIINWFIAHWEDILFAITSIATGVSLIVKITPTLKDDNIWLPLVKWLSKYIALNRTVNDDAVRSEGE